MAGFLFNTQPRIDDRLVSRTVDADGYIVWPVGLDQVKLNAQIDLDNREEDALLLSKQDTSGIIPAAVQYVEDRSTVALLSQTRRLYWDGLLPSTEAYSAGREIEIPWRPLIAVQAVKYLDPDYAEQTLGDASYRVLGGGTVDSHGLVTVPGSVRGSGRLRLTASASWPVIVDDAESMWLDYSVGFSTLTAGVPMSWKQPIIALATYWFNHRELFAEKGMTDTFRESLDRLIETAGGQIRYV